jgi:hypothetical protein
MVLHVRVVCFTKKQTLTAHTVSQLVMFSCKVVMIATDHMYVLFPHVSTQIPKLFVSHKNFGFCP